MAPRPARRHAQRGLALLGLLAVIIMVFAWILTSRLNAANSSVSADREHNARVMSRAKQALIGYVAQQASLASENNPGSLPCPEAPANFGVPAQEGIAAGNCTLPAVGRLPWRTLGLDRLVDAAGEPLWYVVSPGWAMPNSTTPTVINSDTAGQLTVDGAANAAVALIVAPGPALAVQTSAGCTAWSQARPTTGAPDKRNYLECGNATNSFVSNSTSTTFNDQILRVTTADVMPALEAAIQVRAQREIAPALKAAANTLYTSTLYSGIPAGIPIYPYPAPFVNPTTSSYIGATSTTKPQGLLPFNQISSSCAAPHPCTSLPVTGAIRETAYGSIYSTTCTTSATEFLCEGTYEENSSEPWRPVRIEMTATFSDVAMGLRVLASNPLSHTLVEARDNGSTGSWLTPSRSLVEVRMNDGSTTLWDGTIPPRGSATIRFQATLPNIDDNGWGSYADFRVRIQRAVFSDHPLLSTVARRISFGSGSIEIKNGQTVTVITVNPPPYPSGMVTVDKRSGDWSMGTATGDLYFHSLTGAIVGNEPLQVGGVTVATATRADVDIGWFARNQWYRNSYYAVPRRNTAYILGASSPSGCSTNPSEPASDDRCLRFNDETFNIRALLILAGRKLDTQSRHDSNILNYVEHQNGDGGSKYEQRAMRMSKITMSPSNSPPDAYFAPWNDRVILVDWVSSLNPLQATSVTPLLLVSLP